MFYLEQHTFLLVESKLKSILLYFFPHDAGTTGKEVTEMLFKVSTCIFISMWDSRGRSFKWQPHERNELCRTNWIFEAVYVQGMFLVLLTAVTWLSVFLQNYQLVQWKFFTVLQRIDYSAHCYWHSRTKQLRHVLGSEKALYYIISNQLFNELKQSYQHTRIT